MLVVWLCFPFGVGHDGYPHLGAMIFLEGQGLKLLFRQVYKVTSDDQWHSDMFFVFRSKIAKLIALQSHNTVVGGSKIGKGEMIFRLRQFSNHGIGITHSEPLEPQPIDDRIPIQLWIFTVDTIGALIQATFGQRKEILSTQ